MENNPSKTDDSNDSSSSTSSLIFQRTGSNYNIKRKIFPHLSTLDLLIGAVLGVMGGFISGLIPFSLLVKTWYPFVGGTQLVSGHHLLWMAIAYGLTQKINIIPLTAFIKGFINFLLGADWGAFEIIISLYEGLFLALGFLLMMLIKEENSLIGWGVAGGIGNLAQVPFFWFITGKIYILHWTLFVMACMFGFLSGVLISGLLAIFIVKLIKAAHVLDS